MSLLQLSLHELLPIGLSLYLAQLVAVVVVLLALWGAKRFGTAADRDYPSTETPTPPAAPTTVTPNHTGRVSIALSSDVRRVH